MSFETLIISTDAEAIRILKPELSKLGSKLHYSGGAQARDLLSRKKFDAIVVDCDDGGCLFLEQLRDSVSNKTAIKFALTQGKADAKSAFDLGANFILGKPLSAESVARLFKSASAVVTAERRRYFRHAVNIHAEISVDQQPVSKALITTLSEGGMGLQTPQKLAIGQSVKVVFRLPNTSHHIDVKGEVAWTTEGDNKSGIRFFYISKPHSEQLEQWLRDKFV